LHRFRGRRAISIKVENIDFKEKMLKVKQTLIRAKDYEESGVKPKLVFGTPKSKKEKEISHYWMI